MANIYKKIPLGVDDYRKLVTGDYCFIDKTLLIRDILESGSQILLFTRPRRFGKSLNLSMLDYFFNINGSGKGLFDDCALAHCANPHTAEQGKYPVISLSLKEMRQPTFATAVYHFCFAIRNVFNQFKYLLESPRLSSRDKTFIEQILDGKATPEECATSLLELTRMLYEHHGQDTVLLLDEYDVPLDSGYVSGYYDDILALIRSMLSSSCKGNPHLRLAVHTGCLRVAGESIYTGFNNLKVNTILHEQFNSFYGFTPEEVQTLLDSFDLGHLMPHIQAWYDGYLFGSREIYNPWSILSFISEALYTPDVRYAFRPYWANTSGNDLLLKLIDTSLDGTSDRNDIERLLDGEPVVHTINENISYRELAADRDAVWNILFFTGYLKTTEQPAMEINACRVPLVLVNREIHTILKNKIEVWYRELPSTGRVLPLVRALENGNAPAAELELNDFLMRTVSFRDRAENFYHGYIAGLLSNPAEYECRSNRESGNGVSDIRLERKDRQAGTIIEIKMARSARGLDKAADTALKQANARGYSRELTIRGYANVHVYGIACFGKRCRIKMLTTTE